MKTTLGFVLVSFSLMTLSGCGDTSGSSKQLSEEVISAKSSAQFHMSLKESAMSGVQSVIVDVDHVEVLLNYKGKNLRLHLLQDLGPIDLLNLGQSLEIRLADLEVPADMTMSQVRLLLKEDGHSLIKESGESCALQTPSGQQSGLKIKVNKDLTFAAGVNYLMDLSIDLDRQIVLQGNGGCLMKPVIHMSSFMVIDPIDDAIPPVIDDGSGDSSTDVDADDEDPGSWTDLTEEDLARGDEELTDG